MQNTAEKQEETPLHRFTSSTIYAEEIAEDAGRSKKRLIIATLAIGAFVALLAFSYNKSRESGAEAVVATVEPKTAYTRIRPDNPEGAEAPYQEMEVYKGASGNAEGTAKLEKLAPLPEQPMIKASDSPALAMEKKSLADIADAKEEQAIRDAQEAVKAPVIAARNVEDARTVLQQAYQQKAGVVAVPLTIKAQPEKPVATTTESATAIVEESAPVEDTPPAVLTVKKPIASIQKKTVEPVAKEKAVVAKPVQKVTVKKVEPVASKTPVLQPKTAAVKPASATTGLRVQLGAFSSEALAKNAWKTLSAKNSAVLSTLNPHVVSVAANGKTLYRLQAGMLQDRATADGVCAKLKGANQTCIVAK